MLKITNKEFEIEEKIQLTKMVENKEEVVYEFDMKITADELQELKHIMFDFTENNVKKYIKATIEEKEKLEQEAEEVIRKNDERFIDICFKDHKDEYRKQAGEYKFEETLGMIRGYIMGFFAEKQISQMNTPITNLTKTLNSLQKLR